MPCVTKNCQSGKSSTEFSDFTCLPQFLRLTLPVGFSIHSCYQSETGAPDSSGVNIGFHGNAMTASNMSAAPNNARVIGSGAGSGSLCHSHTVQ